MAQRDTSHQAHLQQRVPFVTQEGQALESSQWLPVRKPVVNSTEKKCSAGTLAVFLSVLSLLLASYTCKLTYRVS